ncbi:MAG TPA: alpha/beta hydrolase [Euzebyales bacterium]|nr:alpha/beta hydrolase [Euzebyales bacterium]
MNGLDVRESGTPGSPAIVFLHGVGTSGAMWAPHIAGLASHHCLAPDLPGFGRSNRLPWTSRTDVADQIAALIEARIPSGRAHVVGLSLGGAVAHTLLARRADLLDRVVIDGCGALPWRGTLVLKAAVAAVSPVLHTRPVIAAIGGALALDEATRADLRAASRRAFRRGFADANDIVISRDEITAECATLLVAGEHETRPPVRASNAALAALLPNATARYAPGVGHGWIGQQQDLHLRMVTAWVEDGDLPSELRPETIPWDPAAVQRLLDYQDAPPRTG